MTTHMTPGDAARLLALAQTFDRRTVGETDAAAWADALYDLEPADCAEAIRLHYRESTAFMMPAHVRQRVQYLRAARADRNHDVELLREIEAGKRVDRERVRQVAEGVIRDVRTALKQPQPTPEQDAALEQRCKYCGALPGRRCINAATDRERDTPHPIRIEAALTSAAD